MLKKENELLSRADVVHLKEEVEQLNEKIEAQDLIINSLRAPGMKFD